MGEGGGSGVDTDATVQGEFPGSQSHLAGHESERLAVNVGEVKGPE
jgi:hypothetical protein